MPAKTVSVPDSLHFFDGLWIRLMGISPARHEFLSVLALSFGTVLLLNGYDTTSFVSESVMHSVNARDSSRIGPFAGYYGPSVMYGVYAVACLLAPWICYKFGAKWTLFVGSIPFTLYLTNYFYLNLWTYYGAQFLLGFGFAMFNCGQGQYLSEHSTRETISRNSVMISALGYQSMLIGGLTLILINWLKPVESVLPQQSFRDFSNSEIYIIFGVLVISSLFSNLVFAILPTKQFNSLAQKEPAIKATFKNQMALIWETTIEKRILCLLPFFMFYGLHTAFWLFIFPTSFSFAKQLSSNHYLPAYYSIAVSAGNVIVGWFIHYKSKKNHSFGLVPTMVTQIVLMSGIYALTVMSTPKNSTTSVTAEEALIFSPSALTVIISGLLHGMSECCSATMRSFVCTIAVPKKRLQTYSVAKIFQSVVTCIGGALASRLTVFDWIALLLSAQLISCLGFYWSSRNIRKEEESQDDVAKTIAE